MSLIIRMKCGFQTPAVRLDKTLKIMQETFKRFLTISLRIKMFSRLR